MQFEQDIVIVGEGAVSAMGIGAESSFLAFESGVTHHEQKAGVTVACLDSASEKFYSNVIDEHLYDRVSYFAQMVAREAFEAADWQDEAAGVMFGTSRGTTSSWEHYYDSFLASAKEKVPSLCSPTTTFGSISSSVAKSLGLSGVALDHSVTCSSGLHAVLNAVAMIRAGFVRCMLAGGSEAPLTEFTLAQMKALRIYNKKGFCRPLSAEPKDYNSFMLGEGAAAFSLELAQASRMDFYRKHQCPVIAGIGVAQELPTTNTGISPEGNALATAMRKAVAHSKRELDIDAVFVHAPGTLQGDSAELAALKTMFNDKVPQLLSNKWLIGHCFGASGPLSLLCAIG
ncbi:MAG: hypothetical protein KDD62_14265, partial [Bdellovibrionales bacterium]|nr:hypothetical protein [Bdellovibrionales bacterium]